MAIYYFRSKANYFQSSNRELLLQLHHERTEDRKKLFRTASGADEKSSDPRKTAQGRKNSHSATNCEMTRNASTHKQPINERIMTVALCDQAVSGNASKKTEKLEDLVPIVTYEGNEDSRACSSAKSRSNYAHCEVDVIVHKSSSSSLSTCSSVRSVDQRSHASLQTYGTTQHQVSSLNHNSIKQGESDSTGEKHSIFIQSTVQGCANKARTVNLKETVDLQVLTVAGGTSQGQERSESRSDGTNLGGSLAAMFDF
ncbi:PREDICTED: uncharacterized protein LOC107358885 [Acropora digitifera]|uniref:uncharacterized protein LOC107358885 n=1 Tax=Acropora digitifera TaxID=70779 RepID=UPI00077A301F|nr:PREDICTED: uncharacterized protein LOC107358885 [Acropora digitifera]